MDLDQTLEVVLGPQKKKLSRRDYRLTLRNAHMAALGVPPKIRWDTDNPQNLEP